MALLNIPSSVNDPSYRYKMPRILTQKECRGRGSKTGIMNMGAVAQAIQRDPAYLIKFFGYELGAQTTYTNKKSEGERAVVNGHHETVVFQNLVDKFIEKYVLCPSCNLPETDMVVNKSRLVVATCKACGWSGELDNHHHLSEYISRHPPGFSIGLEESGKKTKEERQRRRAEQAQKKHGVEDSETASYRSDDGKEEQKGKKEPKEKKEKKEKKVAKVQQITRGDDTETASYQSDGQEEQKGKKEQKEKKEKKENKAAKVQQITRGDDTETASYQSDDGQEEQKGKKEVKEKKEKKEKKAKTVKKEGESRAGGSSVEGEKAKGGKSQQERSGKEDKKDQRANAGQGRERTKKEEKDDSDSGSGVERDSDEEEEQDLTFDGEIMARVVSDIADFVQCMGDRLTVESLYEEVRVQQVTKGFDHKLRMYVVVSALFPKGTLDAEGAASRGGFIKAFITNGALSFADWVWGFEAYLAVNPTAKKTWGMTLKSFYDADLVEEEELLGYYKEKSRGNPGYDISLAAAALFVKWLETTPDEDSD